MHVLAGCSIPPYSYPLHTVRILCSAAVLSVWNESIIFSMEILSLYWNPLPFRGGSIVSLPIRFKRRVL